MLNKLGGISISTEAKTLLGATLLYLLIAATVVFAGGYIY